MPLSPKEDPFYEWVVTWRLYRRDRAGYLLRLKRSKAFRLTPEGEARSLRLFETLSARARHGNDIGSVKRRAVHRRTRKGPPAGMPPKANNRQARRAHLREAWALAHPTGAL